MLLGVVSEVRERLVAADVDGPEHDRSVACGFKHLGIKPQLPVAAGKSRRNEELELGTEQADAVGTSHRQRCRVLGKAGIDHDAAQRTVDYPGRQITAHVKPWQHASTLGPGE